MDTVKRALELARLELLDMGLRGNSLLHFRAGAKTLEVVDEVSQEILRLLVRENRSLSFAPLPEALLEEPEALLADELGVENTLTNREEMTIGDETQKYPPQPEQYATTPLAAPLEHPVEQQHPVEQRHPVEQALALNERLAQTYGTGRHTDTKLQTSLSAENLDRRLLRIHTDANAYLQEQGIHILYLALGFLVWFETGNPSTPRRAPLLLIPVTLNRSSARERFSVRYTEADLGSNLTLAAKLKTEFQLELPDLDEEVDPQAYCEAVRQCVSGQTGWAVEPDQIALGFFSFSKFRMYQDLADEHWPPSKTPHQHPTLKALLAEGFSTSPSAFNPSPALTELNFVKDADSSQTEAILAAQAGDHLVIQGPPGTGKSQTITNIIADSLANGKTVLFVAEKMAALEVVKRRLDECQLGATVLELHSHKSNKRSVLEELQRTLESGTPVSQDPTGVIQQHRQSQRDLDDYSTAINSTIRNSGYSFIEALGQRALDSLENLPPLSLDGLLDWSRQQFEQACGAIQTLADHLPSLGVPAQGRFADAALTHFSPQAADSLRQTLAEIEPLLGPCQNLAATLAQSLTAPHPRTPADCRALQQAAGFIAGQPDLAGLEVRSSAWHEQRGLLRELLQKKAEMDLLHQRHQGRLIDQAWQADLVLTRAVWANLADRWWRGLATEFRRARRTLQGLCRNTPPETAADGLALLDDILRYQSLHQFCLSHQELTQTLFGHRWNSADAELSKAAEWLIALHERLVAGQLPLAVLGLLCTSGPRPPPKMDQTGDLEQRLDRLEPLLHSLQQQLELRTNLRTKTLVDLQEDCRNWPKHTEVLYTTARYNRLRQDLEKLGLEELVQQAHQGAVAADQLVPWFRSAWLTGLLNHAYAERPALRQFDRRQHENTVEQFRRLDRELFHHTQARLVAQHFDQLPLGSSGEMEILRREMNKKRRHLPIRQLLGQAGRAVQKIKPVFMMSPMSVATYLQPGQLEFDLVIFDEASQVKVVDAFGPLLRARQAVVVGDTRQMPPTDFFTKTLELDDAEAETSATADIESILSMFLARGARESWLRWHYRSRHDSLIQVSNREFYDNKLFIFPSPGNNHLAEGLLFQHLPNAAYERGGSRTNPAEARAVAAAVMTHARQQPTLTLGVVAFSTAQRDCILQELEALRRAESSCEDFFGEGKSEGFFVKNLENVQGDERDVIFISVGYGRTANGALSRNFGPLNNEGGQRRLNVLITRARLTMKVFCNFTAADLEITGDTPAGVKALHSFLQFAENGKLPDSGIFAAPEATAFTRHLCRLLEQRGYQVRSQMGASGFYLDIALRDPARHTRYLLAIETDGPNYARLANANYAGLGCANYAGLASANSARDRDRLRQQVLEGLGWRFHRIWSAEWFRHPQQEAARLLEAVEQALLSAAEVAPTPAKPATAPPPVPIRRQEATTSEDLAVASYRMISGQLGLRKNTLDKQPMTALISALTQVLACEGPLHLREATRRIAEATGAGRITSQMSAHIEKVAELGHQQGLFFLRKPFIYRDNQCEVAPRNRATLPASARQLELVPPEEFAAAFILVVRNAFSLAPEELVLDSLTLLGFARPSAQMKTVAQTVLDQQLQSGVLQFNDGKISLA